MDDVCFPKGNEEKFVEIAEKLNLRELFCIYHDKRKATEISSKLKTKLKVLCGYTEKKHGIFEEICIINYTKKFGFLPDLRIPITQVHIKELANMDLPLILQVGLLKNLKKAELANKMSFILKLCHKYKVEVIVSSCAASPYLLISPHEAQSILKTLCATANY
jgi:hypothetical protein